MLINRVYLLILILLAGSSAIERDAGNLTVKITGLREINGKIKIGLFNSHDSFPRSGMEYRKAAIIVTTSTVVILFKNIPAGEYAIAYYHDENSDGDFNRNFIGLPKEGYGFSNNLTPLLSLPSYEHAKFHFPDTHTVEIRTIY